MATVTVSADPDEMGIMTLTNTHTGHSSRHPSKRPGEDKDNQDGKRPRSCSLR